jgi:P27 family predicted phage terminase small subunit
MRGRPPKPTHSKELAGNPGRRALNDREPKPAAGAPKCPTWLHKYAKEAWKYHVKLLEPLGLVTQADLTTLAMLCQAWAEFRLATEALETHGRFTQAESGYCAPHPAVAQQRSAWNTLQRCSTLFGLDPSSRARLQTPEPEKDDPFDAFLRGQGVQN